MRISLFRLFGSAMAEAAPSTSQDKPWLTLKETGRNSGTATQIVRLVEKPVTGTEMAKRGTFSGGSCPDGSVLQSIQSCCLPKAAV